MAKKRPDEPKKFVVLPTDALSQGAEFASFEDAMDHAGSLGAREVVIAQVLAAREVQWTMYRQRDAKEKPEQSQTNAAGTKVCPDCKGTGYIDTDNCETCGMSGRVPA